MATLTKVKELPFCAYLQPVPEDEVTQAVIDLFPETDRVHHVRELENTFPPVRAVFRQFYSHTTRSFGSFRKSQLSLRVTSRLLDTWPYLRRFHELSSVVNAMHEIQYEYELFLALGNAVLAEKLQRLIDHCHECVPLGRRVNDQRSIVVLWL